MFSSAILTIPLDGDRKVIVKQTTEWPWKGDITFEIDMPEGASVSLAIRIPVWASDWTVRSSAFGKRSTLITFTTDRLSEKS
jgi:DUF1680 family protein